MRSLGRFEAHAFRHDRQNEIYTPPSLIAHNSMQQGPGSLGLFFRNILETDRWMRVYARERGKREEERKLVPISRVLRNIADTSLRQ